jgi:hypothetical protein
VSVVGRTGQGRDAISCCCTACADLPPPIRTYKTQQAIRSDNPIIFFEHVLLYNIKGETHEGDYCQSLERAEVRHWGGGVWQ